MNLLSLDIEIVRIILAPNPWLRGVPMRRPLDEETPWRDPLDELQDRRRLLLHELKDRSLWFVRARWWVAPIIWGGLLWAGLLRVQVPFVPVLAISGLILGYNAVFQRWHYRFVHDATLRT